MSEYRIKEYQNKFYIQVFDWTKESKTNWIGIRSRKHIKKWVNCTNSGGVPLWTARYGYLIKPMKSLSSLKEAISKIKSFKSKPTYYDENGKEIEG